MRLRRRRVWRCVRWTVDTYCSGNAEGSDRWAQARLLLRGNAGCKRASRASSSTKEPSVQVRLRRRVQRNGEPYNDSKDTLMCDCDENCAGEPSGTGRKSKRGCRFSNDSCRATRCPALLGTAMPSSATMEVASGSLEFAGPACQCRKENLHNHGYPKTMEHAVAMKASGSVDSDVHGGAVNACSGNAKGISFDAYGFRFAIARTNMREPF